MACVTRTGQRGRAAVSSHFCVLSAAVEDGGGRGAVWLLF